MVAISTADKDHYSPTDQLIFLSHRAYNFLCLSVTIVYKRSSKIVIALRQPDNLPCFYGALV